MSNDIKRSEVEARLTALRDQLRQLELQTYAVRGAIEAYAELLKSPEENTKGKRLSHG